MKRFFAGVLVAVLILSFVTCVYCYGEDHRFSPLYYLENLTKMKSSFFLGGLISCWTTETFFVPVYSGGTYIETLGTLSVSTYDGDNAILQFFNGVKNFFIRLTGTANWSFYAGWNLIHNYGYLLPWNAVEDLEGNRIPFTTESDLATDSSSSGGRGGSF